MIVNPAEVAALDVGYCSQRRLFHGGLALGTGSNRIGSGDQPALEATDLPPGCAVRALRREAPKTRVAEIEENGSR